MVKPVSKVEVAYLVVLKIASPMLVDGLAESYKVTFLLTKSFAVLVAALWLVMVVSALAGINVDDV